MTLGEFIKQKRKAHNLTQNDLSKKSKIDLSIVKQFEEDCVEEKNRISKNLHDLAEVLKCDASDFVKVESNNLPDEDINLENFIKITSIFTYREELQKTRIASKDYNIGGVAETKFMLTALQYCVHFNCLDTVTLKDLCEAFDIISRQTRSSQVQLSDEIHGDVIFVEKREQGSSLILVNREFFTSHGTKFMSKSIALRKQIENQLVAATGDNVVTTVRSKDLFADTASKIDNNE